MSLNGKTLFVTGASRGIGLAIALRAARDGANIAIAAKTAEPHKQEQAGADLYELDARDALPERLPRTMVAAAGGLIGFSLALTLLAGPLFAYTTRAAIDLRSPQPYLSAVLPQDTP